MAAYTSTQSGNFNDVATWGGGGYPTTGDTATIAANHVITVPASTTSTCGAITFNAGGGGANFTQLVINGTYNSGGTITTAANSKLKIGAGGVFDLNGNNVACGGNLTYYEFKGTAGSRATVQSTGTAGSFTNTTNVLIADIDYCDFTGLGDSVLGRSHISAYVHNYLHSTFTGCGSLDFEATGTNAGAGINLKYCDFRNPSNAAPVTNNKYYPNIYLTSATATASRVIDGCTWDTDSTTVLNYARFRVLKGLVVQNNVFSNLRIDHYLYTNAITYTNNFFTGDIDAANNREWFTNSNNLMYDFNNNYSCFLFAEHPFAHHSPTGAINFQGNICEYAGTVSSGYGVNWLLHNNPSGQTITIKNNIMIGEGNLITFIGNATVTADISNNTFYLENEGTLGSGLYFAPILLTEQASTLSGTVNIYNNIVIDPDTTGDRDAAIDLLNNTADQVDLLDYNVGWGYPGGALTPPVLYATNVVVTAGEGVNDFSADPDFIDHTRKLAVWDAANGGAGTVANAVTELLKLNSSGFNPAYVVADLVTYVKYGFTPQSAAFQGTGKDGLDIGAITPIVAPVVNIRPSGGSSSVVTGRARRSKQKLILVERVEDVEELLEQIDEIVEQSPKTKAKATVVKPTQTVQEEPQAAFDWLAYYDAQLSRLRDQQRANSLRIQLDRNAELIRAIIDGQNAQIAQQQAQMLQMHQDEEDLLLLLMVA